MQNNESYGLSKSSLGEKKLNEEIDHLGALVVFSIFKR